LLGGCMSISRCASKGGMKRMGYGRDVLIRGSCPGPFLARFCIRDVDEKVAAVGIFCCGRCADPRLCRIDCGIILVLYGRKTGRNVEKFIVYGVDAQWRLCDQVVCMVVMFWKFEMQGPLSAKVR
jgi:hypothetical protein